MQVCRSRDIVYELIYQHDAVVVWVIAWFNLILLVTNTTVYREMFDQIRGNLYENSEYVFKTFVETIRLSLY